MEIKVVGVCGAGIMGSGIAQVAAQAGYQVTLFDAYPGALDKGMRYIKGNLERAVSKGRLAAAEAAAISGRVSLATSVEDMSTADFVIEAVTEQQSVKLPLFRALSAALPPNAIIASNTSGLSLTEMAAVTDRPEKVVGTHFFNPAPVMKLVEVIRASQTSEDTVQIATKLVKSFGKESIEVKEAPLFTVNRILAPMLNEAIFVLQEGIASRDDIDSGMVLGCNHPIGPLALSDMVGLDTLLHVIETLQNETGDPKYRPAPLLRQLVRAGFLGRKSGRGFYNYAAGESPR